MKYFIRDDGGTTQVNELDTPSYASECFIKTIDKIDENGNVIEKATWKEISEQEYLAKQPKYEQPKPSYNDLVNQKIRSKYSLSEELAILRQRDNKPNEYQEYNDYCELCKQQAKKELVIN